MLYEFKAPAEMGVYVNGSKYSLSQVKRVVGADAVCNFQLFNANWTACCFTKVTAR